MWFSLLVLSEANIVSMRLSHSPRGFMNMLHKAQRWEDLTHGRRVCTHGLNWAHMSNWALSGFARVCPGSLSSGLHTQCTTSHARTHAREAIGAEMLRWTQPTGWSDWRTTTCPLLSAQGKVKSQCSILSSHLFNNHSVFCSLPSCFTQTSPQILH